MADSKKYNGSTWEHSLRKLATATEAVENPLYSDGTAITSYTIKGNTVQNGTPTPSNPVEVNGVGERTENLFDFDSWAESVVHINGDGTWTINNNTITITSNSDTDAYTEPYSGEAAFRIAVKPNTQYIANAYTFSSGSRIMFFENGNVRPSDIHTIALNSRTITFTTKSTTTYLTFRCGISANYPLGTTLTMGNIILNEGSTAKPYEPYGYKIPILSGGVTTNIYLGSAQTTRQIGKYIFDGSNIFTTQRTTYRNNTALFATTAMAGTGITNRPSMNNYFVAPSSGTNPQSLDYACSGFHPSDLYSSFYYLRVPYDVIGMTDSNTDNEFITALNTWLSSLYNSGNPMIAYYALATPETAAVNEPLMKIGTYADTLSNATSILTTEGANSITVDTTVQPSEFTATWTGWHDASVKEYTSLLPNNPLCGIDTYKDTLNLATGACTRQIKKLVLDGTEDWEYQESYLRFVITINNIAVSGLRDTPFFCTHYIPISDGRAIADVPLNAAYLAKTWAETATLNIKTDAYTTAVDFKAYLAAQYTAGTPVTIWYTLATPTTETITVPSGLSGTEEGYLNQSGTPTPTNPVYPTANDVPVWE